MPHWPDNFGILILNNWFFARFKEIPSNSPKNVKLEAEDSIVTITLDEVNKILHNKDVVEKENKKTKKEKRNNQFSLDDKHDKPSKKEEKKHEQKDNKQKKRYHNNNQNRQRKNKNNIKNNG